MGCIGKIFVFFIAIVVLACLADIYGTKLDQARDCEKLGGQWVMTYNLHHKCLDVKELK